MKDVVNGPVAPALGMGLVGCGKFGAFCLEAAADLPDTVVVAVADTEPDRATALAAMYDARALPDLDTMLADPAIDVVIVATPPVAHGPMALAAASAGKHVFCEKPLAIDLAAAVAVVEACERHLRWLAVDYVMRWNPLYWLLRRLQDVRHPDGFGVLGPLRRYALENLAGDEGVPADHWFWDHRVSGGIFVEHGVHFFDAAAWLFGTQPIVVQAIQVERSAGPVDTVIASAVHPGGATASYFHAFTHPDGAEYQSVLLDWGLARGLLRGWIPTELELEAWTDAAGAALFGATLADPATALAVPYVRPSGRERIDLDVTEAAANVSRGRRGEHEQRRRLTRRLRVRATLGGETAKPTVYRESVRAGLADLVEAVRIGRAPRVGGADAYASLATALAAQRAAASGRHVEPEPIQLRSSP